YVGAKSRQRWLFYAYDRLRKTVVAHVFGERTMATPGRLMSLLSPFDVVIWMTDDWPLYESRLKGKLHVINKTQRILGASLLCVDSHEMINIVKMVMDAGLPYSILRDQIFTHPSMSESLNDLFSLVK
ncbi:TPA: IS1 family transposase, partial [Escherichia coli]